nr:MAG TPA: hypothetical protein [Caudoviricetes sp.]
MYKPIGWKNRAVEYAHRYEMTQGEKAGIVYLKPAPGEVEEQGTPVNADNLNHMDNEIFNLDHDKVEADGGDVSNTVAAFSENPESENIASGERLGNILGKIFRVIKDFFNHTSDKEIHTSPAEKDSWNSTYANAKNYADAMYSQLTGYTDKKVADLIGGAPETLDTLEEVATAIKENEDVVKALDAAIGKKANQSELDTHTGNDTIHITAAERKQWNGYKEQIAGLNSNLSQIKSVIGANWLKKATVSTTTSSGAHALLTVSGNIYYIYSSGGNLTIINIQNNARPDVTVTVNKLILNITSTANANMLVGIILFNGVFTLT